MAWKTLDVYRYGLELLKRIAMGCYIPKIFYRIFWDLGFIEFFTDKQTSFVFPVFLSLHMYCRVLKVIVQHFLNELLLRILIPTSTKNFTCLYVIFVENWWENVLFWATGSIPEEWQYLFSPKHQDSNSIWTE